MVILLSDLLVVLLLVSLSLGCRVCVSFTYIHTYMMIAASLQMKAVSILSDQIFMHNHVPL